MREKRDSIFKLLLECLDIVSTHNTLTLIILEGILEILTLLGVGSNVNNINIKHFHLHILI